MLNNNISNRGAYVIGVDLKLLLKDNPNPSLVKKMSKLLTGKPNYIIDEKINRLLRKFYLYSTYNIEIVIDQTFWDNLSSSIRHTLEKSSHLNIVVIESFVDVYSNLAEGLYQYFVSNDAETKMLISHRCCITLADFSVLTNWRLPHEK